MKLFITVIFTILTLNFYGQTTELPKPPINWQLLDWKDDGYPGISLEKAYKELIKNKALQKKIIVAIIDDGMEFNHPDLEGLAWTNTKEIAGNGIDDDRNGYTDDIHGWNFIGNLKNEQFEALREYVRLKPKFGDSKDSLLLKNDKEYHYWTTILAAKNKIVVERKTRLGDWDAWIFDLYKYLKYWQQRLRKDTVYYAEIINLTMDSTEEKAIRDWHADEVKYFKNEAAGKKNVNALFALFSA